MRFTFSSQFFRSILGLQERRLMKTAAVVGSGDQIKKRRILPTTTWIQCNQKSTFFFSALPEKRKNLIHFTDRFGGGWKTGKRRGREREDMCTIFTSYFFPSSSPSFFIHFRTENFSARREWISSSLSLLSSRKEGKWDEDSLSESRRKKDSLGNWGRKR